MYMYMYIYMYVHIYTCILYWIPFSVQKIALLNFETCPYNYSTLVYTCTGALATYTTSPTYINKAKEDYIYIHILTLEGANELL